MVHLSSGDEIRIKVGCGNPPAEGEVTEIVAYIDGFEIITNTGRSLFTVNASKGYGIKKTERHFGPNEFKISPEAQRLIDEAKSADDHIAGGEW